MDKGQLEELQSEDRQAVLQGDTHQNLSALGKGPVSCHTGLKWEHLASTQPLTPGHLMGLTRAGYLGNLTFPASAETIDPRHIEDTDQDSDSLSLEIFRTKQTDPFPSGCEFGLGFPVSWPGFLVMANVR